jgi:hypothetical protein
MELIFQTKLQHLLPFFFSKVLLEEQAVAAAKEKAAAEAAAKVNPLFDNIYSSCIERA